MVRKEVQDQAVRHPEEVLHQEVLHQEVLYLEAVRQDAAQYILPAAGAAMEAAEDVFEKLAQFKSISV